MKTEPLVKVNIALTSAQIAALDTLARERILSRASLIRQIVMEYLATHPQPEEAHERKDRNR